jgi:hypothetical protein
LVDRAEIVSNWDPTDALRFWRTILLFIDANDSTTQYKSASRSEMKESFAMDEGARRLIELEKAALGVKLRETQHECVSRANRT